MKKNRAVQLEAFEDLGEGNPAEWKSVRRKLHQHRMKCARLNAECLRRGWRPSIDGSFWVATHPVHGELRSPRLDLLLARVREFSPSSPEQGELF